MHTCVRLCTIVNGHEGALLSTGEHAFGTLTNSLSPPLRPSFSPSHRISVNPLPELGFRSPEMYL
jgi:hypothetical protein